MKIVNGIYTSANIFTDNIDEYALAQIQQLCDQEALKGCKIRVMPDVHPGKVATIGLTTTLGNQILPNLIGIDIGCGVTLARIKAKKVEFQKLDKVIRGQIPSGFSIRKKPHRFCEDFDFSELYCKKAIMQEKAELSLGTLGSGNHFIELDQDKEGNLYAVIHSGSRHLGQEVTEYYLKEGYRLLKSQGVQVPYELTWLEGDLMEAYLHDLLIVQEFAALNRECILDELAKGMKWKLEEVYSSVHNYVDTSQTEKILRKGAISAKAGEKVIIPVNMRDGIILGEGLGNAQWNHSAPHGAGRIMNRKDVCTGHTVAQFKAEMKGIYSSCIGKETLDEAPFAYRRLEEIQEQITETVKIQQIIRPVYNYKAGNSQSEH